MQSHCEEKKYKLPTQYCPMHVYYGNRCHISISLGDTQTIGFFRRHFYTQFYNFITFQKPVSVNPFFSCLDVDRFT